MNPMPAIMALIFVLIPLLVVLLVYLSIKGRRETHRKWHEAARSLGLKHAPQKTFFGHGIGPMTGTRKGFDIRVYTFTKSQGESASVHTALEIAPSSDMGMDLHIAPEHFFTDVGKLFGSQDIQTGDKAFDDAFLIQGSDPDKILALLTPAVRRQMLDLNAADGTIKLTDQGSHHQWSGTVVDVAKIHRAIKRHLRLMGELAQAQNAQLMSQTTVSALA